MKRYIFLWVLILAYLPAFCQIVDTQFGESRSSVYDKVNNRFGDPACNNDESITYYDVKYANRNWNYISFNFKTDKSGITHLYSNELSKDFYTLEGAKKFLLDLKSNLSYDFKQAEKEENVFFSYEATKGNKDIELYIFYNKNDYNKYSVWLSYEADTIDYEEQDLTSSIMSTNFGDTYSKTLHNLESNYNYPDEKGREFILYKDVVFAEKLWNQVFFSFLYTSTTSHLNCIVLVKGCDNAETAKIERDEILKEKIHPSEWGYKTDKNGFKDYIVSEEDRKYIIRIRSGKDFGFHYVVTVSIFSKEYSSEDNL